MKINPYKYPFIVLEGINGCGKTLISGKLQKWSKDNHVGAIFTSEPTNGEIGQKIREILGNNGYDEKGRKVAPEELQGLFIRDRLEHRKTEAEFLNIYSIFSERDCPSTFVFGMAEGLTPYWILNEHNDILGDYFFVPDITFIFDVDPEEAVRRSNKSGNAAHYFEKELTSRIKTREFYLAFPGVIKKLCSGFEKTIVIIDASPPPEKILKSVIPIIEEIFRKKGGK